MRRQRGGRSLCPAPFRARRDRARGAVDTEDPSAVTSPLGAPRRDKLTLTVDWSQEGITDGDVTVMVYVDGELDTSKCVTLDAAVTRKEFSFSGSGKKSVKVKINGTIVYNYILDFDAGTVAADR